MTFWQRLFFPKTTQLADAQEEIAHQREINAKLVDAVCRGRGEQNVFAPEPKEPPFVRKDASPAAEEDDWRATATLETENRLIRDAVDDPDAYQTLWQMAEEGVQGAQALLDEADERLAERKPRLAATEEQEAVQ